MGGALRLAQPAGHLEAVEVGQHDVEDDEVGPVLLDGGEGGPPRGGAFHLEAVKLQAHGEQLGDLRLVVNHENPLWRSGARHGAMLRVIGL